MPQILDSFDTVISDLNELNYKVAVYRDDWVTLPIGVKNALKAQAVTIIDTNITALQSVKDDINNL